MKKIKEVLKKLRNNTSQKLNLKTKEYEYCYTIGQAENDIEKIMLNVIDKEFGKIPSNKVIKDKALKKFAQHYYQGKFDVLMNLMMKIRKPKR